MDTKQTILRAALALLETEGEAKFSTRSICEMAAVTAPTLYHHFGSADGLLSAAIDEAFAQFIAAKRAAFQADDPIASLGAGWDNYVDFAAARPRLYAAMMTRFLSGADLPAARKGQAMLRYNVELVQTAGLLAIDAEAATQLLWATANSAAMLCVSKAVQAQSEKALADLTVVHGLRDWALGTSCKPRPSE